MISKKIESYFALTKFLHNNLNKTRFIRKQVESLFKMCFKVIMELFLHTDKQDQEKHIL